jgi:hypothetical protein
MKIPWSMRLTTAQHRHLDMLKDGAVLQRHYVSPPTDWHMVHWLEYKGETYHVRGQAFSKLYKRGLIVGDKDKREFRYSGKDIFHELDF